MQVAITWARNLAILLLVINGIYLFYRLFSFNTIISKVLLAINIALAQITGQFIAILAGRFNQWNSLWFIGIFIVYLICQNFMDVNREKRCLASI